MKYNIFFVDDEFLIREVLRDLISDNPLFTICGEAADGEVALMLMQDLKPDILITDIRMPFMNGLELARIVKKTMPWVRIIILSGHDEFEYARKSISVGVDEFLLKPVCADDILKSLNQIALDIERERTREIDKSKIEEQIKSVGMLAKNQLLDELLIGGVDTTEAIRRAGELGIALLSPYYLVALTELPLEAPDAKLYFSIRGVLEDIMNSYPKVIHFFSGMDRFILIFKGEDPNAVNETAYELARAIIYTLIKKLNYPVSVGVGSPVCRVGEIATSYFDAQRAYRYIRYMSPAQIANAGELNPRLETHNFESLANSPFLERLKFTKLKDAPVLADQLLRDIRTKSGNSMIFSNYILIDVFVSAARFIKELGGNPSDFLPRYENEKQLMMLGGVSNGIESLREPLVKLIADTIAFRDECGVSKHADIIKKAQEYVRANYADASISLQTVAKAVSVSPNYFSTIFSQEAGETFTEYLTSVRLKKSVELLLETGDNLVDIAFSVGYNEPHYFGYLFKRYFGLSPGSYRTKHKNTAPVETEPSY